MRYGAPCEQGVGEAGTMPLRDMEAPGLVPAVDGPGVGLATKEARRHISFSAREAAATSGGEVVAEGAVG